MNDTVAILRGEDNAPFKRWFVIAVLISLLLHVGLIFLARHIYFQSEEVREQPVDMKKYTQTRVNVDPKYFKPLVASDMPSPAALEAPKVTVAQAAMALEERQTLQRLVENTRPEAAAPPRLKEIPAASKRPQIALPEGSSDLKQLPASSVFSDVDLIHQNSLGKMPTAAEAMPRPNSDIAQNAREGNGLNEEGVPGFQRLAELLKVKPEEVVDAIKQGAIFRLDEKVLFDYDRAEVKALAEPVLMEIITLVNTQFPKALIYIDGYTDSTGAADYNLVLSEVRANAVKEWLVKRGGLSPRRFIIKGHGATNFVVPPTGSIAQQALNRRTEIRIISQ